MCKSVQEYARVCKSVQECVRVCKCARVCKSVQECARVCKCMQECARVCERDGVHALNGFCEVGVKGEKLFSLFRESSDLCP